MCRYKIRYCIEPRGRIFVTGDEFLSFAKNKGKKLSRKHRQKLLIIPNNMLQMCVKMSHNSN